MVPTPVEITAATSRSFCNTKRLFDLKVPTWSSKSVYWMKKNLLILRPVLLIAVFGPDCSVPVDTSAQFLQLQTGQFLGRLFTLQATMCEIRTAN